MKVYEKGDIYKSRNDTFKSYGIHEIVSKEEGDCHFQKIIVYGDINLRNKIIRLLNKESK